MTIELIDMKYVIVSGASAEDKDARETYMRTQWGWVTMTAKKQMTCKICEQSCMGYSIRTHFQTKGHVRLVNHYKDNVDPEYGDRCTGCPVLTSGFCGYVNKTHYYCRLGYAHKGVDLAEMGYVNYDLSPDHIRPQECITNHG